MITKFDNTQTKNLNLQKYTYKTIIVLKLVVCIYALVKCYVDNSELKKAKLVTQMMGKLPDQEKPGLF